jgi:hypothetical protein
MTGHLGAALPDPGRVVTSRVGPAVLLLSIIVAMPVRGRCSDGYAPARCIRRVGGLVRRR